MNNYFVMYETEGEYNSFLITDAESASKAWDDAVEYIEKEAGEEIAVITKFEFVK